MKVKLSDFQEKALNELRNLTAKAAERYSSDKNVSQVISFSAPTGAGKTIIMAALMESIFHGDRDYPDQPDAIFVWLSDSPQLNAQSREKIESKADRLRSVPCVTIEDDSFDQEILNNGHIYFLNIQKLSVTSNLTKTGDDRTYTIWETLKNTVQKKSDRLYFIIDEAHRGMQGRKEKEATTIVQKFLKGSDEVPRMPVVIGMSATPERFKELLEGIPNSNREDCKVTAKEVRSSGLLKDRILVMHRSEGIGNDDMTILRDAVNNWKKKCEYWDRYCENHPPSEVNPVLVVQVENSKTSKYTDTDIDECLRKIEGCVGHTFEPGEVVHTFGDKWTYIKVDGRSIYYEQPSHISGNPKIKVVFFKENLSTGWDCPRAETMVSFRHKEDYTSIAQLVGRIVRTPLHRRIPSNDVLNSVSLYLPHFDQSAVLDVVRALGDVPTSVETVSMATLTIYPQQQSTFDRQEVLDFINRTALPSYKIQGQKRRSDNLIGMFEMAHILNMSGVRPEAESEVRSAIVQMIREFVDKLKADKKYDDRISRVSRVELAAAGVDFIGKSINEEAPFDLLATEAEIDRKFRFAENVLGDEGIGKEYGRQCKDENDPSAFKKDVILFAYDPNCITRLDQYASKKFKELENECGLHIPEMKDDELRNRYDEIAQVRKFVLPETIQVRCNEDVEGYSDSKHLFVDEKTGLAKIKFDSSWEEVTLTEEKKRKDFVCWIRNFSTASWALAIPYEGTDGAQKLTYPDFIIVRKNNSEGRVIDILEPHWPDSASLGKAKGFAKYAQENQTKIGRIQLIHVVPVKIGGVTEELPRRLDLAKPEIQEKVLQATTPEDLEALFDQYGFFRD